MRKFLTTVALAAATLTAATQASAETRVCTPKVDWVGVDPGGNMLVALSGMGVTTLCNVSGTVNTSRGAVTSETCKGWYAGFTTVRAQRTAALMWYDFGPNAAPQCDAFGYDWSLSAIYPYLIAFS